ncbi:type II CRISPR-associated endonuclease Cas1 [uncultured Mediterranea sp.]|uniref:type II CRISPR-associated endonuclease Cas1 n=1 Tax=uncultured Mediterranea sp. TaxID=1926662 RepID=UPI002803F9F0|nr:type II CRISPR-associated endonuclease Cas1 [uncultured Mediterranea sp.]
MIKQTLFFTTPVSLSLKYDQIEIRCKDTEEVITRPIEDVGVVIVENQMVHFTIPLLNALADNNVAVVFCNAQCMPNAMLMPLESNAVQQEVYRFQLEASLSTKKRIWKEIIEYKIRNQAALLDILGFDGKILKQYYMNVLSGDSDNREGVAAKIYWQQMYGRQFNRNRNGEPPNSLLNYGYTILRAAVSRALFGSGLFPAFGLFHRNRYNAFPLADDVMEPYRPFVDYIVYQIFEHSRDAFLEKETKRALARVLFSDVKINGQTRPLQVALSITTASLVRSLRDRKERIVYPSFV